MSDNIVDLGAFRVSQVREHSTADRQACKHKHLQLDDHGDVVRCVDCNTQVSAYWALRHLLGEIERSLASLRAREDALAKAKGESLHLLAARKLDKAWREGGQVPACPHCGGGIFPEDVRRMAHIDADIERRRRAVMASSGE